CRVLDELNLATSRDRHEEIPVDGRGTITVRSRHVMTTTPLPLDLVADRLPVPHAVCLGPCRLELLLEDPLRVRLGQRVDEPEVPRKREMRHLTGAEAEDRFGRYRRAGLQDDRRHHLLPANRG